VVIHGGWNCPWWPCFLPLPLKPKPPVVTTFSDTYALDPDTMQWSMLPSIGEAPAARYGHKSILRGSSMVIFGGHNGTDYFNDMWSMEVVKDGNENKAKWTQMKYAPGSQPPKGRVGPGIDQYGDSIFVWNGEIWKDGHDERITDMWKYNLMSGVWTNLEKTSFPSYLFSLMHVDSLKINLFIGGKCNGPVFDKVVYLDLTDPATDGAQNAVIIGEKPSARYGQAYSMLEDGTTGFLYGGYEHSSRWVLSKKGFEFDVLNDTIMVSVGDQKCDDNCNLQGYCSAGKCTCFPGFLGGSTCTRSECAPGEELSEDKKQCVPCSYGAFSSSGVTDSSGSCMKCNPGYFMNERGGKQCTKCRKGTHQQLQGQDECQPCDQSSYAPEEGLARCKKCRPHSSTLQPGYLESRNKSLSTFLATKKEDCVCLPGYFGAVGSEMCTKCPTGASCCSCPGLSTAQIEENLLKFGEACEECASGVQVPIPKPGYVKSDYFIEGSTPTFNEHGQFRPETRVGTYFVQCRSAEMCVGGPENKCATGFQGVRCGTCAKGYFKTGRTCESCPADGVAVFLLMLMVALVATWTLLSLWLELQDPRVGNAMNFVLRFNETFALLREINIVYPGTVDTVMSICAVVNMNIEIFRVECILGIVDPEFLMLFAIIVPFIGAAVFLPVYLLWCVGVQDKEQHLDDAIYETFAGENETIGVEAKVSPSDRLVSQTFWGQLKACSPKQFRDICIATWVKMLTTAYPFFCMTFLPIIVGCQELVDGDTMLSNWPSISCDERGAMFPMAIFGALLWCAGTPLALGAAVYMWQTKRLQSNLQAMLLRNIFCGHRGSISGFMWRIVGMLRTFLIVFVCFLPLDGWDQSTIIYLLLVSTLYLEARVMPRTTHVGNICEATEELILLTVLFFGNLYNTRLMEGLEPKEGVFDSVVLVLALGFIFSMIGLSVHQFHQKYKRVASTKQGKKVDVIGGGFTKPADAAAATDIELAAGITS